MFDVKAYLESGIVELHCLGIARKGDSEQLLAYAEIYPAIKQFLEENEKAMESYIKAYKVDFSKEYSIHLEDKIFSKIADLESLDEVELNGDLMLNKFVSISKDTDTDKIEAIIKSIKPPDAYDGMHAHPLYISDKQELLLVWVKDMVPEEIHTQEDESFIVLEGTADCYVGEEVIHMKKGDFMRIPLHVNHKVVITSSTPAKALRSRVLIA